MRIAQAITAADAYDAHRASGKASAQCTRILAFIAANDSTDCEKYAEAVLAGWRVIRVTSTHVNSGEALEWIRRALQ